jgi:putative transposase
VSLQGKGSIERMCQLAQVSRSGYYRFVRDSAPKEEENEVRAQIQTIVVAHRRRYGYRRVTKELRSRGMLVNHKRVARLMREDNLLAIRYRKFLPTTDSGHGHQVQFNLARRMHVTDVNQLWVADITYIRLREEFVYLAVVLDLYSRRIIGWSLDRSIQTRLPLRALEAAIADRQPPVGVVHHSDRGAQYACPEYVDRLLAHGMVPSMSRPGCPYDNAACESFMKTLKQEEIYATAYRDLTHLRENLKDFIDQYYNRVRLHSALGYRSPEVFEAQSTSSTRQFPAPNIEFSKAWEIYQSDVEINFSGAGAELHSAAPCSSSR